MSRGPIRGGQCYLSLRSIRRRECRRGVQELVKIFGILATKERIEKDAIGSFPENGPESVLKVYALARWGEMLGSEANPIAIASVQWSRGRIVI